MRKGVFFFLLLTGCSLFHSVKADEAGSPQMLMNGNKQNKALQDYPKDDLSDEPHYNTHLFMDIYYAYYYIAENSPENALKHLCKAEEMKNYPIFGEYAGILYDAYAEYYCQIHEYDKAITAIDSSIAGLKVRVPKDYYRQLVKKAAILKEAGRSLEALPLYQESLHGKDSINHILSNKQIEQIQSICHSNKLLLEIEQLRSNRNFILLVIILLFTALFVVFIIRDLFVRKKLKESEHEMREATRTAEKNNEIKNLFLSNMSYNMRTPLNNVVGFSQLMAADPDMDDEQRREYSAIIKKNSEILLNLVNDVLDISRLEAGMMKFNLQEYEVITLCKEACYAARKKGQPVTIDFRPEFEELSIKVDVFRFNQLLVSLLTYPTPVDKAITITLTVALDKENDCVRFKTIGSPIACTGFITQEVTIRNDINNLFLKHFGGTYNVVPESPEGPVIFFTYPLSISE